LKGVAQKVMTAVREKTTHRITGNDMATLIKEIENNNIFSNHTAVAKAIE
jgi:hypothetical protein